ncbi:MAG: DUF3800 domain-containing protein, partial [Candidatus Omnitrophica bacterium]|nr:DUF3800 domain-containing protein [Candidatus Omnitrophota bacterium]
DYCSKWSDEILKFAEQLRHDTKKLRGLEVSRKNFESRIITHNPHFVMLNGHGDAKSVTGHADEVILSCNESVHNEKLSKDKERVYNYIARLVMDKIPFEKAITRVELIVDKSKSRPEIEEFNSYIMRALKGRLDPKVPLDIYHYLSHENTGLQAADMFCWGISRKYEKKDIEWLEIFRQDKVRYEDLYLP